MWWLPLIAAAEPSAVDSVRARWKQVQGIKRAGALYAFEIDANPEDRQWAAVGNYQDVITCHRFTRGEAPYPQPEPILVELHQSAAAAEQSRTFLYTDQGELVFAHASSTRHPDWRVYWTDEKVLRVQRADKALSIEEPPAAAAALWASGMSAFRLCVHATKAEGVWTELPGAR
ncbi:MAG TPA: hypothetical protein DFR83_16195 [Deltaproteobacteria bacterium]|nr:hypothetical protein [Deltaproteobacteria bacterium]